MTHNLALLTIIFLFVIAGILISEWAVKQDRVDSMRPRIVKTIAIDPDTEIERQEGWQ